MGNLWRFSCVLFCSFLVAGVTADPKNYDYDYQYDPNDPYNNAIPVKQEVYDYHAKPKYAFGYEVDDYYTQLSHGRWEIRDGDVVQGQYRVLLPDGRIQIVSYIADKDGYRPTIQYVGQGVHPPPPPAYANVKVPKYIEPEPEFYAVTPTPVVSAAPIVKAPLGLSGPMVEHGPLKLRVNPAVLTPIDRSAISYQDPHYGYDVYGGYGQGYGQGYGYDGGYYEQASHYDPVFAGSKVSKKRALLYDRTLFRKDVEKRAPKVKRSGSKKVKVQV